MPGMIGFYDPKVELPKNTLHLMRKALFPSLEAESILLFEEWGGLAVKNFNDLPTKIDSGLLALSILGEIEEQESQDKYKPLFDFDGNGLAKLHGSYIAVKIDKPGKQLSLITDRFGSYPCYFAKYKHAILFATQIKAILNILTNVSLDRQSVAMMLSIGEVINDRTLINEVKTFPAATISHFNADAGIKQTQYWHYLHELNYSNKREKLIEETGLALMGSVNRATQAHSHASIPLSGGLDSRFILGLAHQQHIDFDAFTWGTPDCRDLRYSKQVTQITHSPHHTYHFDPGYLKPLGSYGVWLTEGHIPAVHFHVLPYINEVNVGGNNVLLDGFAGDATLGGNFVGKKWLSNNDLDNAGHYLWHWRLSAFLSSTLTAELSSYHQVAKEEFIKLYKGYAGESSMDKCMSFLLDNRVRRITTCGTEIFRSKVMVKQPFMDIDVINVTRQIPHEWRIRHQFYLEVMKKYVPDVSKASWQRTCLPASSPYWLTLSSLALQRIISKSPFNGLMNGKSPSQFDVWFRNELRSYIEETLFCARTIDRAILPIDVLRKAWDLHQMEKIDATNLLGSALTIELFCRLFIDDLNGSIEKFSA